MTQYLHNAIQSDIILDMKLIGFLLILSGCSTTLPYSVVGDNVWFVEQDSNSGFRTPIFCMSNIKDGDSHPVCRVASKLKSPKD
jgi:hypothetical protein